jgi:hypothetical protein
VQSITEETLAAVIESFSWQKQMLSDAEGSHIEYMYLYLLKKNLPSVTCSMTENSLMSEQFVNKYRHLILPRLFYDSVDLINVYNFYLKYFSISWLFNKV